MRINPLILFLLANSYLLNSIVVYLIESLKVQGIMQYNCNRGDDNGDLIVYLGHDGDKRR